MTDCFMLEPIPEVQVLHRQYTYDSCPEGGGHEVSEIVGREDWPIDETVRIDSHEGEGFPDKCRKCGETFEGECQLFRKRLYRRQDTEALTTTDDAAPGAMWYGDGYRTGPDGKSLYVKCPDGHVWFIDGRATNCTRPEDNEHRCWVREGTPPNITAGKEGNTCGAGAGSIQTPDYHGFLRDGAFT